ncbi:hypothetical protein [Blastococcus brunescens]|uniref:Major facilitator superfamily (MFS) profile domain-containing protein n=1 Tax=Blastococcus brunescens TaxID=1564165 RepID=A0ABZ1B496_9ACTN|nr:hypothetical protein [Blastococcus sp. BMG 8361]WRL65608.1 hypothetical protein U6N30_08515 [Blastococcus sp. BMG 8361]
MSTVLVATTVGAVVGPNMVTATGRFAESIGVPGLAGPFMLAGLAYAAAGVVLFVLLRPDPLLLARDRADQASAAARASGNAAPEPAPGRASGWSPQSPSAPESKCSPS